jgi:hypothetical protein
MLELPQSELQVLEEFIVSYLSHTLHDWHSSNYSCWNLFEYIVLQHLDKIVFSGKHNYWPIYTLALQFLLLLFEVSS